MASATRSLRIVNPAGLARTAQQARTASATSAAANTTARNKRLTEEVAAMLYDHLFREDEQGQTAVDRTMERDPTSISVMLKQVGLPTENNRGKVNAYFAGFKDGELAPIATGAFPLIAFLQGFRKPDSKENNKMCLGHDGKTALDLFQDMLDAQFPGGYHVITYTSGRGVDLVLNVGVTWDKAAWDQRQEERRTRIQNREFRGSRPGQQGPMPRGNKFGNRSERRIAEKNETARATRGADSAPRRDTQRTKEQTDLLSFVVEKKSQSERKKEAKARAAAAEQQEEEQEEQDEQPQPKSKGRTAPPQFEESDEENDEDEEAWATVGKKR